MLPLPYNPLFFHKFPVFWDEDGILYWGKAEAQQIVFAPILPSHLTRENMSHGN